MKCLEVLQEKNCLKFFLVCWRFIYFHSPIGLWVLTKNDCVRQILWKGISNYWIYTSFCCKKILRNKLKTTNWNFFGFNVFFSSVLTQPRTWKKRTSTIEIFECSTLIQNKHLQHDKTNHKKTVSVSICMRYEQTE